ncbi:nose resistant to fluoxetine protein 6-like [Pieris napi]|uniref:nose resistant to fluoxetine protein 6-like n=1 Tax=Pieris napi TaxID=78633 RepID=UPI001FBB1A40|nr:nose resistant to fluoxetine protein 6-like [Pieris napi]
MKIVLFLIIFVHGSYGVIFRLNDSMYDRMPPLHKMDNYEGCLENSTNRYCLVHFTLVSEEPNDLLYMIQEYSMKVTTHLNYTYLRYGMCLKHKCDNYKGDKSITSRDHLGTCLNDTFSKNYGLKTVITDVSCNAIQHERLMNFDMGDVGVAMAVFLLLALNIIGSIYDAFTINEKHQDQKFLLCFSIRHNWKRLTSCTDVGDEMSRFQILYSIRSLIIIGVISSHILVPFLLIGKETKGMEDAYLNPIQAMFLSGPLLIQTYFVMSGFLLAYKMQIHFKRNNVNLFFLPRLIFFRWLRLTPPYAVLLAFMATWLRFFKTGPFWEISAGVEVADCRNRWWFNLLYINNYIYHSQCMPHSWYIAADMQLYVLGAVLCLILRYIKRPTRILLPLFLVGLLVPAVHTYLQDLDPMLLLKPTGCATFFDSDKTYNEVYKRGHTNMVSFIIGLSTGYMLMNIWKTKVESIKRYKKYFFLLWFIIPIGAVFMYIGGSVFYRDAPRDSIYVRTIFAMISRPFMGFLAAFFMLGMILKIESLKINEDILKDRSIIHTWRHRVKELLRVIMNWDGWMIPGKLSYCVYLIHFPIIRITTAVITTLIPSSPLYIIAALIVLTVVSFILAVPISLMVEIPFIRLIKEFSRNTPKSGDGITTRL